MVDLASFCLEVAADAFNVDSLKIGGIGKELEIDETTFGKRKWFIRLC